MTKSLYHMEYTSVHRISSTNNLWLCDTFQRKWLTSDVL